MKRKTKQLSDKYRQKRLGQYFTGDKLSRLLAVLAEAENYKTIIDPMAGIGDMLKACAFLNTEYDDLSAIEVDPIAYEELLLIAKANNINLSKALLGSAFDNNIINKLNKRQWDLVITNPPYVRYQALSKELNDDIKLDSSSQIREKLKNIINNYKELSKADINLFNTIIKNYSGLSDLAVPSWILCAALVKRGGTLAMVVPESWLNREYSYIIQYMLLRCFRILYVVEDADATWFNNAQVKTNLIIAKRVETIDSISKFIDDERYIKIRLTNKVSDYYSIVGNLYSGKRKPERCLLNDAKKWLSNGEFVNYDEYSVHPVRLKDFSNSLKKINCNKKWFKLLEKNIDKKMFTTEHGKDLKYILPHEILQQFKFKEQTNFISLEQLGVGIGQGLRTGANTFFYVDFIDQENENTVIKPNPIFNISKSIIPSKYLELVLRKQSELDSSYVINTKNLTGRVLFFTNIALKEDIERVISENQCEEKQIYEEYDIMSKELALFVKKASVTNVGSSEKPKFIPKLTAVAPNVRKGKRGNIKSLPRFWYMLPEFTNRHRPDIAVPRINSSSPRAILNKDKKCIVDANFSTLWITKYSSMDEYSILALLNSTWVLLIMELSATVMGGGALKLEATHLKRLPIPIFTSLEKEKLSLLGKQLAKLNYKTSHEIINEIDRIVEYSLFNFEDIQKNKEQLKLMLCKKIKDRRKG